MSSDVTEWHDVAAGRGNLCNWMMGGARLFFALYINHHALYRCITASKYLPKQSIYLRGGH